MELPLEVKEKMERYWNPFELLLGLEPPDDAEYFDPNRLVFFPKETVSRCDAWIKTLKTKKAKFEKGKNGNGWRKCHTENYWCYYAKYLSEEGSEK